MGGYVDFVLKHRFLVLMFFLVLTVFFGSRIFKATLSSAPGELFFGQTPEYEHYLSRTAQFGNDVAILIAVQGNDLTSPRNLDRLDRVVEKIMEEEDVARVFSLVGVQNIESVSDELRIDYYADLFKDQPHRKAELLKKLATDELSRDMYITPDGKSTVVLVEFEPGDRSLETAPRSMGRILAAFEQEGFAPENLYRGGLAAVMAEILEQSIFNLKSITPMAAVVLFISVYLMFRRLWPVVLTGLITLLAVIWTIGLAVMIYGHLNVFTAMIPALVLIICFADVIHLASAYNLEIALGLEKRQAILQVGREVGTACGFTSLTTFFGFASMTLVPSPVFRQLGFLMGFGVAVALYLAITLVPIFLYFMPVPGPGKITTSAATSNWLDRLLEQITKTTTRRPRIVILIFLIIFIGSTIGTAMVRFDTRFAKRFPPDNPIQIGLKYLEKHFHGTYPLDIYLTARPGQDLFDPNLFAKIEELEAWIEKLPQVTQVISVVDLIEKIYREIDPAAAERRSWPDSRKALAQLLFVFELSGGQDLDRFVDHGRTTIRMAARIKESGVIETAQLGRQIMDRAAETLGESIEFEVLSLDYLVGNWVEVLISGQRQGLGFALLTIALLMMLALRSIRNGLLSMLPNVLPLLMLLGYVGLFWDRVDTDAMAIMMVAIGIGVDDTIHFMMRLRFEMKKNADPIQAIRRTMHYSGRAIIITSLILMAGFACFATSDYFSVRIMGTLLPFSLASALAADLFLVPAMVKVGWFKPE